MSWQAVWVHAVQSILLFQVQEVPGEEFEGQDLFLGPVLRISCPQLDKFLKPVTVQLPVSLRSDQLGTPDPSTCRVRVLFLNSDGGDKKWMDITDNLKSPVNFDGTFVTFQVERFSGWEEIQTLFFSFEWMIFLVKWTNIWMLDTS